MAPVTPLLALHAEPDALDLVTAVLLAPPVVAWAFARWFGTAMSVEAIKIAARDLADFPLPVDDGAWHEAAAIVRSADGCDPADSVRTAIEAATSCSGPMAPPLPIPRCCNGGSPEHAHWYPRTHDDPGATASPSRSDRRTATGHRCLA
ncbi:MAG: hypothetical protein R2710_14920 [Acidimicrobiales bacterium]